MIKKVIALIFVSFFVMSGLTVLTENNQNYNIGENNINSFVDSSAFNPISFSLNQSITYSNSAINGNSQTFVCYNNILYYINGQSIYEFNTITDKISAFLGLSIQPYQLEIYNNYLIIGYGAGATGYANNIISVNEVNIYNFENSELYVFNLTNSYNYLQFVISNNSMFIGSVCSNYIYIYSISLRPISISIIKSFSISDYSGGDSVSFGAYNNNLIFASDCYDSSNNAFYLKQFDYINITSESIATSISNGNNEFEYLGSITDFGNIGILTSQSYYITNKNSGGTTQYSYNDYSTNVAYDYNNIELYFSDSNYKNSFIPANLTNYAFTKLSVLTNNSKYQEFCYNGILTSVYLPIGSGNTIFNTLSYVINGNNKLYIVDKNNVYVYNLYSYNLNVKSYNSLNNQIQNYFSMNGIIYTGYSNSFSFTQLPQTLIPLNTSTYYYNGSAITIIQSDFTGSGSNLYYNLSIYYNQIKPASIPLYDIFTYMYPISIIGLFVGMGAFVFAIKKRGYKI